MLWHNLNALLAVGYLSDFGLSLTNANTHTLCCAFNHALSTLNVNYIEIFKLDLGDLAQLVATDRADLRLARGCSPFFNSRRLFQQVRHRRCFRNKCERAIFIDRYFSGDDYAPPASCQRNIFLSESHIIDALMYQRNTNVRRFVG